MPIPKQHTRKATIRPKKNTKEYFIWCDESVSKGKWYSNFYGGVLVKSEDLREVQSKLQQTCRKLHLFDEIKWNKVSQRYVVKYMKLMDAFFELIASGKIRVRIMFTQNGNTATPVTERRKTEKLFASYYQLIQHAFGLSRSNATENNIYLRLYFDYLPGTFERKKIFTASITTLQTTAPFRLANLKIRKQDIAEVDSKKHLLLQLLDVVLGAICFRLNNRRPEISLDKKSKGNRTVAKEKLYRHIYKKIKAIRPGFAIGATTGLKSNEEHWKQPYRHWNFKPPQ